LLTSNNCQAEPDLGNSRSAAITMRVIRRTTELCAQALRTTAPAAVVIVLCAMPSHVVARYGPFADMVGSWFGGGRIYTADGSELIRCRARYAVRSEGAMVHQDLVCASPSYRFNVDSNVADHDGNISGTWRETTRDVTGQIVGVVRGGRIEARILGGSFAASLSLVTRGNTQTVTIVPQGTDVREVTVSLRRS
jgi:hypothetical protein